MQRVHSRVIVFLQPGQDETHTTNCSITKPQTATVRVCIGVFDILILNTSRYILHPCGLCASILAFVCSRPLLQTAHVEKANFVQPFRRFATG